MLVCDRPKKKVKAGNNGIRSRRQIVLASEKDIMSTARNKRPSLTRAETIESCNSDDLVTVLEVHERKPYKIMDRSREVKKGVMAETLAELIERGKEKLNYPSDKSVYVVLDEDGTEVDEEEYFQTLPENTVLILLHSGDKWSPYGPPFQFCELLENEIQV